MFVVLVELTKVRAIVPEYFMHRSTLRYLVSMIFNCHFAGVPPTGPSLAVAVVDTASSPGLFVL